jgi:hypothetical protein
VVSETKGQEDPVTDATLSVPFVDDRRFLRNMVTVMSLVIVAGFATQFALGRSSFNAPLVVHAHGVAFMAWVAITVAQAWLAAGASMRTHRQLGKIAAVWTIALLILGPWVTIANVQTGRTPFFFQPQHFLIANPMTLIGFAGLFFAAIHLRRRTDWHARLHVSAFVILLGPGFGRLLPMPLLPPYAFEIAGLTALVFPLVGILRDWRVHGRPHAAWFWGIGVLLAVMLVSRLVAFSPLGEGVYDAFTAGTGLAGSDGLAFPPPPPGPM